MDWTGAGKGWTLWCLIICDVSQALLVHDVVWMDYVDRDCVHVYTSLIMMFDNVRTI